MSKEINMEKDWHQTKGLSLSIIILLIINIVSTVWWAATLTSDVAQIKFDNKNLPSLRLRVAKMEGKVEGYDKVLTIDLPLLRLRVAKMEGKLEAYDKVLNRLIIVLDRLDTTVDRIDREQSKRGPLVYKKG